MLNISRQTKAIMDERVPFIQEGFVTLNPAEMNSVICNCSFHNQRNIHQLHVSTLAMLMTNGDWLDRDKIDFALIEGRLILINGHHRGAAQIKAGIDILWTVVIHRRETMTEVDQLYYSFDTNSRKRTGQNILQGIDLAENFGITKTMASSLFNAAPIIGTGFGRIGKGSEDYTFQHQLVDQRLKVCDEFKEEVADYEQLVRRTARNSRLRRKLLTAGVCAVALVSLKYRPLLAEEFWGGLADDDGLRKGDPRKSLIMDFFNRKNISMKQSLSCVRAWNAYYRDEDLQLIRLPKNVSTKFLGTPYAVRS